jgi:hypothetical protein
LLPFVAVAVGIAATASVALAGTGQAPGAGLLLEYAGWVGLATALGFLLALGVSSLLDSRATSVGVLLAWQLAVAPLLLQTGKLDSVSARRRAQAPGTGHGKRLDLILDGDPPDWRLDGRPPGRRRLANANPRGVNHL